MGEAKRRAAVPSLREWLDKMIPSRNANERDAFADFADWTSRMILKLPETELKREAMLLRMIQAVSLAIVEVSNYEVEQGTQTADIVCGMVRSLGVSFGYALMSLTWADDAPLREFVRPMQEEFAVGLKFAIDECLEPEARDA